MKNYLRITDNSDISTAEIELYKSQQVIMSLDFLKKQRSYAKGTITKRGDKVFQFIQKELVFDMETLIHER